MMLKNNTTPVRVTHKRINDHRGFFQTRFSAEDLKDFELPILTQENFSLSHLGVIRGWHWQVSPFAQAKLVTCLNGKILDLALDLRHESATFGEVFTFELDAKDLDSVWIPVGFAHAFQAVEKNSLVLYSVTSEYNLESTRAITPNDSTIKVDWPIKDKILSQKDSIAPYFNQIPMVDLF